MLDLVKVGKVRLGEVRLGNADTLVLSKVKAMAIASNLSNILKVLLMVMRWRMASSCSKLHKNHFLIIPSNMQSTLYPQIYRGLISIDRFFPFFLWLSVFFLYLLSS